MPMLPRILAFLAPSAAVLALFAAGLGLLYSPLVRDEPAAALIRPGAVEPEHLPELGADKITVPTPAMSPTEVVETQLAGLADTRADGIGILQCFALASPGNRAVTGPLDRFGAMVRQGAFACLAKPRATLVGAPQVEGVIAKLLVTVVDERRQMQAFTFILSKQVIPPYEGCWMTEAVLPMGGLAPPKTQPEPAASPDSA
jgi:hypothetical protein